MYFKTYLNTAFFALAYIVCIVFPPSIIFPPPLASFLNFLSLYHYKTLDGDRIATDKNVSSSGIKT